MSDPSNFVSSIKVKGLNLLPPVITAKRRADIDRDRQQAIKLEKRLQKCRDLKKNIQELLSSHVLSDRPQSAATFGSNSHVDNLGITSARSTVELKRKSKLTKDIVDVSEYSNDGIKIIDKDSGSAIESVQGQIINDNQCDTDTLSFRTDLSSSKTFEIGGFSLTSPTSSKEGYSEFGFSSDLNDNEVKTPSPRKSPKARLIRSNSYTLEAPSPILLAHLEKFSKMKIQDLDENREPPLSTTWTSLENNYVPFEQSEFSSLNTVFNYSEKCETCNNNDEVHATEPEKDTDKETSPTIEVIQTDISVQQITVNAGTEQIEPVKTTLDLSDPDCKLMEVLKKIPEDYSKQIIELIEKQRSEHSNKVENFGKQFVNSKHPHCSTPLYDEENSNLSAISHSPSQSIYYSFCSSDTVLPTTPTSKIAEFVDDNFPGLLGETTSVNKHIYKNGIEKNEVCSEFSKKKFNTNYSNMNSIKKDWAACVIGAHAKGYLTRRLLKTERVQSLIDTIRDALLCALQLHTVENIDEADVELHRRLINQVSAACYAFHDIFFALSIPEKMAIISADRKRRIEKAKRPQSAYQVRRSLSNSSRSSTRSVSSTTQSLTKI